MLGRLGVGAAAYKHEWRRHVCLQLFDAAGVALGLGDAVGQQVSQLTRLRGRASSIAERGPFLPHPMPCFVDQFERVWQEVETVAEKQSYARHEIVTLASIIEKETAAPEERPLIASVFHNRLKKKMRLETDPTVIYGIDEFDGNLTRAHLRGRSNPYNTYRIPGLPPGPIASPGIDALRAALEPAEAMARKRISK